MRKITYVYSYNAVKEGSYDKFHYGVFTITLDEGEELDQNCAHQRVMDKGTKLYPDNDYINVTALNRL